MPAPTARPGPAGVVAAARAARGPRAPPGPAASRDRSVESVASEAVARAGRLPERPARPVVAAARQVAAALRARRVAAAAPVAVARRVAAARVALRARRAPAARRVAAARGGATGGRGGTTGGGGGGIAGTTGVGGASGASGGRGGAGGGGGTGTPGCSGTTDGVCPAGCTPCTASCTTGQDVDCKLGNGTPCTHVNQCVSGNCVDSVCCNSACSGSCNTCASGTCAVVAAGGTGSPSCSPYRCNGSSASCPTSCTSDTGVRRERLLRQRHLPAAQGRRRHLHGGQRVPERPVRRRLLLQRRLRRRVRRVQSVGLARDVHGGGFGGVPLHVVRRLPLQRHQHGLPDQLHEQLALHVGQHLPERQLPDLRSRRLAVRVHQPVDLLQRLAASASTANETVAHILACDGGRDRAAGVRRRRARGR